MANVSFSELFNGIDCPELSEKILNSECQRLAIDSRKVESGDTFIAMPGFQVDGRKFIKAALDKGASWVIAEAEANQSWLAEVGADERIIWLADLRAKLSFIAANFYHHPSTGLKVVGVTGTNGKTSCSYLIAKTLQQMHFECFLLGTLGVGQSNQLENCENTTADAITMQRVLAQASQSGAQFASMEVSSHGLDQRRTDAVKFIAAIFTNLSHDHLDYHGSMDIYFAAKRRLFLRPELANAVINMDDKYGRKLVKDEAITATKWLVTTKLPTSGSNLNRWVWAENIDYSLKGLQAKVYTPWGSGELESPLIGEFNLSNLLLVIATLGSIFKDVYPILNALKNVRPAPGRMQKVGSKKTPLAIIDYAHTPDALEQSLKAIREHCVGMIWCVFGCGGDRDSTKRPLMARIAEKLANRVIVTNDNPRTEDPESIRNDIFSGFRKPDRVVFISDRAEAIEKALRNANQGDAVLVAGKGHEDYQIIGDKKSHLSDLEIASKVIKELEHD